jgi:hypothetical protein
MIAIKRLDDWLESRIVFADGIKRAQIIIQAEKKSDPLPYRLV